MASSPSPSAPALHHEASLWQQGLGRVAGVDEVGRGALAGCVVAAAVVLPPGFEARLLAGVKDSKQLSRSRREVLDERIRSVALAVGVGAASVVEIDRLNIRVATARAMARALVAVAPIEHALVDGLAVRELTWTQTAIVGGDRTCLSIAAASIVAKVARDRWMACLGRRFQGYGWERNVGYGTAAHLEAMNRLGPTPFHRRSFAPVGRLNEANRQFGADLIDGFSIDAAANRA